MTNQSDRKSRHLGELAAYEGSQTYNIAISLKNSILWTIGHLYEVV